MESPDQYGVDRVVVDGGDAYIDFGTEENVWGGGNEKEGSNQRFSARIPARITEYLLWKARGIVRTMRFTDAVRRRLNAALIACGVCRNRYRALTVHD